MGIIQKERDEPGAFRAALTQMNNGVRTGQRRRGSIFMQGVFVLSFCLRRNCRGRGRQLRKLFLDLIVLSQGTYRGSMFRVTVMRTGGQEKYGFA